MQLAACVQQPSNNASHKGLPDTLHKTSTLGAGQKLSNKATYSFDKGSPIW